ncbi:LysR family transcriptional regulator [Actinomycetospora straminea]|uniref:LysR family transcriptional regulator n=1 Tax=Actinomycetospora straminea TaxID=663607 RepID=A0ABP9FB84_9PSEU|nr:LysR family transcriptional regulator [Actinomycetospora straminea]MDD7936777.1 LysR family transcriptional regulator [Actinomycetospora straminea]
MDVTLQQLRVIVAVHEAGGFTAAAASLRVAQPSLSRTVAEVERRLGTGLFTRTTRRLETTTAGLEFVALARRVLDGLDEEMRRFADFLAGARGRVRVATLPSLAALLLPGVVAAFRAVRPEVDLTLSDALADEVVERVRTGGADLAVTVVSVAADVLDDLEVLPVAEDTFCALLAPGHPLAGRDRLAWADLAGESFIDFDPTTSIRHHVDHALVAADVRPRRVVAARNVAAVAGLVAAGLGVSAVPGLVVPLTGFADLVAVPLEDPVVVRRMALVRGAVVSPAAAAFADLLVGAGERPTLPRHARWLP